MKRRGQYGHIINISSMSGHRVPNGASGGAFYAATKHALRALTEGLRQEVRHHQRGNCYTQSGWHPVVSQSTTLAAIPQAP